MQGYFYGLLALTVACAAVELLAPEGEGGGLGRYMRLVCALCLLSVLATPLVTLVSQGSDLPGYLSGVLEDWLAAGDAAEEDYADRWQTEQERLDLTLAGDSIAAMVAERFDLPASDVTVRLTLTEDGRSIETLRIGLSGQAIWLNTHELEDFIQDTFGCSCTVYIE